MSVAGEVVLQPDEPMPEFLAPLENLTATQGRDVTFTCVVNHLGKYKVAWIKSDSKAILAIHTHLVAHNPRLTVTHNGHNTWKLHINNVHQDDSGIYMCQVNTEPMRSQMGHLDVVVPPDILSNGSTDSATAPEGGTVRLRCVATGVPPSRVTWRREDAKEIVLRQEGGRDKQSVLYFEGETLTLTGVQRSDMGVYLCIASNGIPPSVSKRFPVTVLFAPLVKVSNQLVAAPVGSDVTINCYVEASPGALCTWHKDTDGKLMEGSKYAMSETPMGYSLVMNLTIRSLEARDFGSYTCMAKNPLGSADGTIRLQELHLPPKTTTAATHAHPPPTPRKKLQAHHKEQQGSHVKRKKGRMQMRQPQDGAGGGGGGGGQPLPDPHREQPFEADLEAELGRDSNALAAAAAAPAATTLASQPGGRGAPHHAAPTRPTLLYQAGGVSAPSRLPALPLLGAAIATAWSAALGA
ncbi:lachesin-like [Schistocerca nitens]|uniref:lachesin-like n=1 Tax=Schistocerca nitens TaxID=7011 RepID=UPI002117BF38|nr:lachesin-like [Schistocerca nitens]